MMILVQGLVDGHHTLSGGRVAPLAHVPFQLLNVIELYNTPSPVAVVSSDQYALI